MESSFAALKAEHLEIWQSLQKALQFFSQGQIQEGIEFLKKLERSLEQHYEHENNLLFLKVFGNPKLSGGGPFCTLYYDSFMHHRPLRQLMALMRKIDPQFQQPPFSGAAEKYVAAGSPLAIPSEEHLAILSLVKALIPILENSSEQNTLNSSNSHWRSEALNQLQAWIRSNHDKEERCLFALIGSLLT